MIVPVFLTDPYIVVIATIVTQLFCSWSEGRRERGETGLGRGKQNTKIIRREELWPKNTQLSYPASAALISSAVYSIHLAIMSHAPAVNNISTVKNRGGRERGRGREGAATLGTSEHEHEIMFVEKKDRI